jgi:cellulose synthase/poly-beta-1,6-N-acetylglucosamine synthase-like glycosyltransferase
MISDAEDKPGQDQMRKIVTGFRKGGDEVARIQTRLNYFNGRKNALTRLFALDDTLWVDHGLPAFDRLGSPIPPGGTSSHFHTDLLRAIVPLDRALAGAMPTDALWRAAIAQASILLAPADAPLAAFAPPKHVLPPGSVSFRAAESRRLGIPRKRRGATPAGRSRASATPTRRCCSGRRQARKRRSTIGQRHLLRRTDR